MKERGSASVLMVALAGLLALLLVASSAVGMALAAREQAMTAAEAAALAAAAATLPATGWGSPPVVAARAATANGARLVSCDCRVDASLRRRTVTVRTAVEVTVPVFGRMTVRGAARAEFDPVAWLGY
ncbi:MAG: hypothetical protein DIU67_006250 [Actinomycetes bacterium]|jgi:secretion/DNA translocation related TadE-like protein|nr:MAG: hypothetical protein DIU67_08735 [Actinomycetota bacterium]